MAKGEMGNGVVGSKCGSQKTSISIKLKVDGALSRRGKGKGARSREKVVLCAVMAFLAVIFSVSFQMKFFKRRAGAGGRRTLRIETAIYISFHSGCNS